MSTGTRTPQRQQAENGDVQNDDQHLVDEEPRPDGTRNNQHLGTVELVKVSKTYKWFDVLHLQRRQCVALRNVDLQVRYNIHLIVPLDPYPTSYVR